MDMVITPHTPIKPTPGHGWAKEFVDDMLLRNGREVSLRSRVNIGSDYDPEFDDTDTPVQAAEIKKVTDVAGFLIEKDDKLFWLKSDIAPTTSDLLIDENTDYTIINVQEYKAGELICAYVIQVRA